MHAIAQLHSFTRAAKAAGMAEDEIDCLIDIIADNPSAGDEIPGTGGCRKVRFAAPGRGKSGGYRIITFFTGETMPVFLITVFAKGERANLSKAECNKLGQLTKAIAEEYRARAARAARRRGA